MCNTGNSRIALLWSSTVLGALFVGMMYGEKLISHDLLTDEKYYIAAAAAVKKGISPNTVAGWFYPSPVAYGFLALFESLGEYPSLLLLRALNTTGMLAVFIFAASIIADGFRRRSLAPGILVLLFVGIPTEQAFSIGNISGILFLPMLLLVLGQKHATNRAVLLVLGVIGKPYALGIACTRPWRESVPAFITLGLLTATTTTLTSIDTFAPLSFSINASPWRLFVGILHIPWQIVIITLIILAMSWGKGNYARGICIGWAMLPAAWLHSSMILLIPASLALRRWLKIEDARRSIAVLGIVAALRGIFYPPPWNVIAHLPISPLGTAVLSASFPFMGVVVIALLTEDIQP